MTRARAVMLAAAMGIACDRATTPAAPVTPSVPLPVTSSSTVLRWPLGGVEGRDWVINNYVDLDPTSGILDYTGAKGGGAKTYDGHRGVDIDVPNFRWMDGGVSVVFAAAGGVVTAVHDSEPDRNTSCAGNANVVHVRHVDGLTAIYGHLKKGSAAVTVGQQVSEGTVLGVVGSSGCSTAPHLHFELRDAANVVVDPFRDGLWAQPPAYNTPITLMDVVIAAGAMTPQQIKDPAPNVKSVPGGTIVGVGVSMAGGGAGDVIRLAVSDPTGATVADNPVAFTTNQRHSYWLWNIQFSSAPGVWTVSFIVNGATVRSETVQVF